MRNIVIMFSAVLGLGFAAHAATITVAPGGDYQSLADAVAAANDSDEIRIADGIYEQSAELTVTKSVTIRGNDADPSAVVITNTADGARVMTLDNASAVVSGLTLTGGIANGNGSGLYLKAGVLTNSVVRGNTFNSAGKSGIGICMDNTSAALVVDCVVSNNEYPVDDRTFSGLRAGVGFAICSGGTNAVVRRTLIADNFAQGNNGVSAVHKATLYDCVIEGNKSWTAGSAIGARECVLHRCIIRNNEPLNGTGIPGGLYNCYAYDCLITGNKSSGSVPQAVSGGTLVNCTIAGNINSAAGCVAVGGTVYLYNCIVRNNYYTDSKGNKTEGNIALGAATVVNSCTSPIAPGKGNVDGDPCFADPDNGDYTLSSGSIAFNSGDASYYPGDVSSAFDIAGNLRVKFGVVDMGCYEKQTMESSEVSIAITSTPMTPAPNKSVTFTGILVVSEGVAATVVWDWGDGTTTTETYTGTGAPQAISASHAWTSFGRFDLSLSASVSDGCSASSSLPQAVTVQYDEPKILYVSKTGSDVNDGLSWESALATPGNAVIAAAGGSTIHIADGEYETTEQLNLAKQLVIIGNEADPSKVVLANVTTASPGARVVWLGDANSKISGVTLTGGLLNYNESRNLPGGAAVHIAKGVVSNCVIRANTVDCAWMEGGIIQLANDADAVMADCVVTNNWVKGGYSYGVASCLSKTSASRIIRCEFGNNYGTLGSYANVATPLYKAVAEDCHIHDNDGGRSGSGGATESALYRCRVVGNSSHDSGTVLHSCIAYDCLVVGNTAKQMGSNSARTSGLVVASGGSLYNCTIASNIVTGASASDLALYAVGNNVEVYNSIVWNNGFTTDSVYTEESELTIANYDAAKTTIAYSCTSPMPGSGEGNISNDPDFKRDFSLKGASPCIDVGSTDATYFPNQSLRPTDIAGKPRVRVTRIDMGCHEQARGGMAIRFR